MNSDTPIYNFTDPEALLEYLDDNFRKLSNDIDSVLKSGMQPPDAAESHLLLPVQFDDALWTRLVWDHWEKIAEEQYEAGVVKPGTEITEIMSTYFNGLAEAVAADEFSPKHGSVLPVDHEESQTFDYYKGLEELDGWKSLQAKLRAYGIQGEAFLAPVFEDNTLGLGLVIHSGTTQPLLDFINSGHIGSDYVFPEGGAINWRPC